MANDLVVRVGARLDDYEAALDRAGSLADDAVSSIEQKFSSINPAAIFSNIGTAVAIGAASIPALIALVAQLNKGLDDLAKTAERVGLSLQRFQELQFAANASGVSSANFGTSLESFSQNITTAQFKVNDLKRVFDANGVSIKDGNDKLKDTDTLLTSAIDIIKRAPKIQDALEIGGFLGISKELTQSIFDSGDGFLKLASQANAAGAVIDDETIKKAQAFTTEWNKATAIWGASFKAQLNEFLPLINDAVAGAQKLLGVVKIAADALGSIKDFAIAPNIDTASFSKLNSLLDEYAKIRDKLSSGQTLNPIELFQASNIQQDGKITVDAVQAAIDLIQQKITAFNQSPKNRLRITADNPSVNPGPKLAEQQRDPFQVAIDNTDKRIAALKAEAATIDESTAARERAKTVAQLEEAAKRANTEAGLKNVTATDAQRAAIEKEADAVQKAADAYAKRQVESQIKFSSGTAFLSQEDVQIAQQLKGVYGTDIPAALNSTYASAIRVNDATKEISNTISTNLTTALADVSDGTKTAGQAFGDFGKVVVRALEEAIIKLLIVGPLMRSLQSGFGSLLPGISGGPIGPLKADGTFASGGYTGSGGKDEPAGIVHRGEFVFDKDTVNRIGLQNLMMLQRGYANGGPVGVPDMPWLQNSGRSDGGNGNVTLNLIEDSSRAGQVQKGQRAGGGLDLSIFVDSITAKNMANPGSATRRMTDARGRLTGR